MKKITIYAIHSNKLNYKEEFYKAFLLSKICTENNLILPLTDRYKDMYAKDLVKSSDIIIVNLTNATLSVFIETKWAIKMNKKILFLIKDKGKCNILLNRFKKNSKVYFNVEDQKKLIDEFINLNLDEIASKDELGTINLGSLNKK